MSISNLTFKPLKTATDKPDTGLPSAEIILPVLAFFRARGLQPEVDRDGDIVFTVEGDCRLIYRVSQRGHTCHSVLLMRFYPVDSPAEFEQALRVAAQVNAHVQVAKLVPFPDAVSSRADLFGDDPTLFMDAFDDIVGSVMASAGSFWVAMAEAE